MTNRSAALSAPPSRPATLLSSDQLDLLPQFLPSQWLLRWSSILCTQLKSLLFFGDWWLIRVLGLGDMRRDVEAIRKSRTPRKLAAGEAGGSW